MNNEKLKVAYVAELDQDVDDIIAVQYLYDEGILDYVVLDPFPTQQDGKERMQILFDMGITVKRSIQPGTKTVFVGGPLTEVARYLRRNKLDTTRRLGEPRRLLRAGGTILSEIRPIKGVSLRFFSFF